MTREKYYKGILTYREAVSEINAKYGTSGDAFADLILFADVENKIPENKVIWISKYQNANRDKLNTICGYLFALRDMGINTSAILSEIAEIREFMEV